MNAPLPEAVRRALEAATLDDKYSLDRGRAFMSGVQALVRLPMLQRQRDLSNGLNTAGFISGYRGSPLGGYDQSLWKAKKYLQENHIVFQPGVNEELAATAIWGTQQLGFGTPEQRAATNAYDGVFGIWYGKGPGVDRCSDVFKHANNAGTSPHGGVIALAGDDHVAKSSTAAHQSDHIFKACGFPVFFPTNVQEYLDLGLHAFAMSRYAGVWTGMKTIQEIVESSASVYVDPDRVQIQLPTDFTMPPGGVHIRWPDTALEQEARLMDFKWYAALAYVRANRLNETVIDSPNARLGIMASGKAYNDTRQALHDLGLDDARAAALGVRLQKVTVVWPLEATLTREFATGLREILVVEEKRQVIEYQVKEELYGWRDDVRPNVLGKFDEHDGEGGEWSVPNPSANTLLRANADLSPAMIAKAIGRRLKALGVDADTRAHIDARLALIDAKERAMQTLEVKAERQPWFCSGCPHNTSTVVPDGSKAMAGIGCHFMAIWMDRSTVGFTQMGGEGVPWVGQQPFLKKEVPHNQHVFANLGDGTYFHSGLLAIRQAIAAGVNITYKVLYNDAVAMTGGQQIGERPEGHSVPQILQSVVAEGAVKVCVVTDQPEKYQGVAIPAGVTVHHRSELDAVQRAFREIKGTSVIVYDQTCATEKRRRRKRGAFPDPAKRLVINELVCEGCGDCSVQSNCLSVEPLETEFGRKRQINQSTCNKDYSCVNGFCPSFVTVEGGELKRKKAKGVNPLELPPIPLPSVPAAESAYGIVVAGVGGTGVITIGQLLGMAAHLEGKGIATQDSAGLAQKGGSTWSHIQIANRPEAIHTTRVGMGEADLIIGCDTIVTATKETVLRMRPGRTRVALNTHGSPTAAFVKNPNWQQPEAGCEAEIAKAIDLQAHPQHLAGFDAEDLAVRLMGDSIYTNPLMLGFAWQLGWVPLSQAALLRAIELNDVQVERNKQAFEWGRRAAHNLAEVEAQAKPAQVIQLVRKSTNIVDLIAKRAEFLTQYQNAAYAEQYKAFVERVRKAEQPFIQAQGGTKLTEAVARNLFKLMAYKDEYEVARLHSDPAFLTKVREQFEGDVTLKYNLAPPAFSKRNDKGELVKREFGPWMGTAFKLLKGLKFLRGTVLDPFGRTEERRTERALIEQYKASIERLLPSLDAGHLPLAIEIARIPEDIRGYGHVKERHLLAARAKWAALEARWAAADADTATPVRNLAA